MLSVSSVSKKYLAENDRVVQAADNVGFEVPRGKLFTLLGPSGCGKTTTLRSIAGLEKPDAGEISVDGRVVYSSSKNVFVPSNKRDFGMVFQSYAIWPHMTVFQNVAFPLQVDARKYPKRELDQAVSRVLHIVALDGLEDRPATQLSGGQQQRLALARALIKQPPILLLDEPLSNLDAKLRERMRFELKRLQQELNLTCVYVTHDQSEALALSHELAVMSQGKIIQIGSPRDIYEAPKDKFVADFVGVTNLISGTIVEKAKAENAYTVRVEFGVIVTYSFANLNVGDDALVSIRPEHINISTCSGNGSNVYNALVETQVYLGDRQDLEVRVGNTLLQARTDAAFDATAGGKITVAFDPAKCILCRI
jgi:iron(III) transport system ATP-binding protein